MAAGFVFEMIGKKFQENDDRPLSEQFLLLNSYVRLEQTRTTLLADSIHAPREIGVIGAYNACEFVIVANTGRFWLSGIPSVSAQFAISGPIGERPISKVFEGRAVEFGELVTSGGPTPVLRDRLVSLKNVQMLLPPDGDDSFYFGGQVPGPGRMDCTVYKALDGAWYVQSYSPSMRGAKDYVTMDGFSTERRKLLDSGHPFKVNDYTILGPYDVWNNFPKLSLPDTLTSVLAKYPGIVRPSFNCSGQLDPSAATICKVNALARMDGVLGKLYAEIFTLRGNRLRESQRHWIKVRDRACRPGGVNANSVLEYRSLIQCLVHFYTIRLTELERMSASR